MIIKRSVIFLCILFVNSKRGADDGVSNAIDDKRNISEINVEITGNTIDDNGIHSAVDDNGNHTIVGTRNSNVTDDKGTHNVTDDKGTHNVTDDNGNHNENHNVTDNKGNRTTTITSSGIKTIDSMMILCLFSLFL